MSNLKEFLPKNFESEKSFVRERHPIFMIHRERLEILI